MPPAQETVFLAQPEVAGRGRVITSPFQFQFTGEDRVVVVFTSSVTIGFSTRWRFQELDGTISVIQREHQAVGDRIPRIEQFAMGEGFVSNLVVQPFGGSLQQGQLYVTVYVARTGGTAPGLIVGQLLGGYTTFRQSLAWPGSPIIGSTEGHGANIHVTFPGANLNLLPQFPVPTNTRWAIQSVHGVLLTTATAGSRTVNLIFGATPQRLAVFPADLAVPPSAAGEVTWGRGLTYSGLSVTRPATAPLTTESYLTTGDAIRFEFGSPDLANDVWDDTDVHLQEWLQP